MSLYNNQKEIKPQNKNPKLFLVGIFGKFFGVYWVLRNKNASKSIGKISMKIK